MEAQTAHYTECKSKSALVATSNSHPPSSINLLFLFCFNNKNQTWSLVSSATSSSTGLFAFFGDLPALNVFDIVHPFLMDQDHVEYFALPCSSEPKWSLATLPHPAPFILNSRCSVHISNHCSDFSMLSTSPMWTFISPFYKGPSCPELICLIKISLHSTCLSLTLHI